MKTLIEMHRANVRTLSLTVNSNKVADDGEQIQRVNDVLMVFEKARQK